MDCEALDSEEKIQASRISGDEVREENTPTENSSPRGDEVMNSGTKPTHNNELLDVRELIERVKLNQHCKEQVKGKDILLFIGDTGAGKTTTIQFLAERKMAKRVIASYDPELQVEVNVRTPSQAFQLDTT